MFIIYTTELQYLLQSHEISCHFYADDTQIYFKITGRNHDEIKINRLMTEIRTWMTNQKLNADKTEMNIIGTKSKIDELGFFSRLKVDESQFTIVHKVKSLGIFVDKQ